MAYTYNKPDASDKISSSQSVLKDNFTAIKQLVDVNHATFGDPSEGKHNIVHFPQLTIGASIPAATSASEYALYNTAVGGSPALFIRIPGQSAGSTTGDINLTGSLKTDPGWCMLPCGIIMKWASGGVPTGSSSTITLANGAGIPDITTMLSVQVTAGYGSSPEGSVYFSSYTNTPGANSVLVRAWKPFSGSINLGVYVLIMGV